MASPGADGGGTPLPTDNQAVMPVAVAAVSLSLATALVAARLYTRAAIIRKIGPDDVAVFVAWILTLGTGIVVAGSAAHGLGYHLATLPVGTLEQFLKWLFTLIILYNLALMFIKAAFLLQYQRIFNRATLGALCTICNVLLGIVIAWGLFQVLMTIFFCRPTRGFWDITINATCMPKLPFWTSNSVVNLITDVAIITVPLPTLHTLRMGRVQKRVLMGVFSVGFFTCAISIVRLTTLKSAAASTDATYDNASTASWTIAELCCGLGCACVPTLRPLVERAWPGLMASLTGTGSEGRPSDVVFEMLPDLSRPGTAADPRRVSTRAASMSKHVGGCETVGTAAEREGSVPASDADEGRPAPWEKSFVV